MATLLTAKEARDIQSTSIDGTETASQSTATSILNYIDEQIKTYAKLNRDYCDITWSSIKNGRSTDLILTWINIAAATNDNERYYGIQTEVNGEYTNQWTHAIGQYLTSADYGYRWTFLYKRDATEPYGLRVCWQPADHYTNKTDDPIERAHNTDKYIILPQTKLTLPIASEVEVVHVQEKERKRTSELMQQVFTSINEIVQKQALEGYDNVFIPWNALSADLDGQIAIQNLFVDRKNTDDVSFDNSTYPSEITATFKYGTFTSGSFSVTGSTLRTFKTEEYDIGFFNDKTYSNDNYVAPKNATFTLISLLTSTSGLGYQIAFYANVDPNTSNLTTQNPYCEGICLSWGANAITIAQQYWNMVCEDYIRQQSITYTANATSPTFATYKQERAKNHSAYLQSLVTLINSKMATAFGRNERCISILWSEISANLPEQVLAAWTNDNAEYDGEFPAMHASGSSLPAGSHVSLSTAFNTISRGSKYWNTINDSDTYEYLWAYCYYNKDGKETWKPTDNLEIQDYDLNDRTPAGLVIALFGKAPESADSAIVQTATAIRQSQAKIFAIVDPANKK